MGCLKSDSSSSRLERRQTPKSSTASLTQSCGVDVAFQDVGVTTGGSLRRPAVTILHAASGCIRAGQLTALLGSSGAGKTTLMHALAGRTPEAHISGSVRYGQHALRPGVPQRLLAYVEQEDALIPNLTVLEMLQYACELCSVHGVPAVVAKQRAEKLLQELGLQACRHVRIGGDRQRGVSGGQRRRVSIGEALASSPAVLMLDEPTSGLDSAAAIEVVSVLRRQADRGVTVLASVHQPSVRLLSLFDSLVLAAGGWLVYQGPNGADAQSSLQQLLPAAAALSSSDLLLPEWLLDVLDQATKSGELEGCQLSRQQSTRLPTSCSYEMLTGFEAPEAAALTAERPKGTWACFVVLLKYRMWADYRSALFLLPRIVDKLAMAFIMGTLFLGAGSETGLIATMNIANLLLMWILLPGFSAVGFLPPLMLETKMFVRERHAGLYPVLSYLAAKMAGELLVLLPCSVVLAAMVWFLAELSGSFLLFWLPYLASMAIGVAVAYLCAAVSPTMDLCILLLAGYVISILMFSGLVKNWGTIPGYWEWYAAASYMHYAWSAVMVNQFEADPRQIGPSDVLSYFSLDGASAWGMLGVQCAFFAAYFLLAWAALWVRETLPRCSLPCVRPRLSLCGRGSSGGKAEAGNELAPPAPSAAALPVAAGV